MATKLDPIDMWSDPRVEYKTALVNGQTYKYLLGVPKGGKFRATVFLVCFAPLFSPYLVNGYMDEGCQVKI
jgi:soluble epoxide hydrolase/lipid-phosphate phosphatase